MQGAFAASKNRDRAAQASGRLADLVKQADEMNGGKRVRMSLTGGMASLRFHCDIAPTMALERETPAGEIRREERYR